MEWKTKYMNPCPYSERINWREEHRTESNITLSLLEYKEKYLTVNDHYRYRVTVDDHIQLGEVAKGLARHSVWDNTILTNDLHEALEIIEEIKEMLTEKAI